METYCPMAGGEEDYYVLLGLSRSCSAADIKKAYRKNAVKWHPVSLAHSTLVVVNHFRSNIQRSSRLST